MIGRVTINQRGQVDDLKSQQKAMETYCLNAGISVDEWISEIGGGLNFKPKKLFKKN